MTPRFTDDVLSLRSLDALLATSTFEPFDVAGLAARHGTPDGDGLTADTHLFLRPGRPSRGGPLAGRSTMRRPHVRAPKAGPERSEDRKRRKYHVGGASC